MDSIRAQRKSQCTLHKHCSAEYLDIDGTPLTELLEVCPEIVYILSGYASTLMTRTLIISKFQFLGEKNGTKITR